MSDSGRQWLSASQQDNENLPRQAAGDTEDAAFQLDWRQYEHELQNLCIMKAEEFQMLGYQEVTADEVWQCVRHLFRKEVALHELVSAIVGLKVGQFMNYVTMNAYKGVFGNSNV